ncbi:unnamed protein product [Vitrella brassicaformis CCMP3155]|uniref:Uncharacterized protein n=1 Tax=Vitrella brassicaformis (strain CCMP3155) TaxID=1169540 RepID=A0A0G4H2F9_VITBC|nr:unnamed protein product [Vitrella brassicaformis CCMP3155]|eukprot:CEM37821.1 unnamed protein product [Vitrella brassicaformis CCMP3155]
MEARRERIAETMRDVARGVPLKLVDVRYLVNRKREATNLRDREILACLESLQDEGKVRIDERARWAWIFSKGEE